MTKPNPNPSRVPNPSRTILCSPDDEMPPDVDFTLEVDDEAPLPPEQQGGCALQPVPALIYEAIAAGGESFSPPRRPLFHLLFASLAGGLVVAGVMIASVVPLLSARKNEAVAEGAATRNEARPTPRSEPGATSRPSDDHTAAPEKPIPARPETAKQPAPRDEPAPPKAAPGPAEIAASAKSLQMIGLGLHDYHDVYHRFPAQATYGGDGKPLLSWRVAILPYIDQRALYREFKQNEPWDSPHNKKLIAKMPRIYAPFSETNRSQGLTFYQVFVGKGTMFEGREGLGIGSITRGTSNTIAAVEGGEAVIWTKPDDLPYSADKPLPKLGGLFKNGFHILMADAMVLFTDFNNEQNIRRDIMRDDRAFTVVPKKRDDGNVIVAPKKNVIVAPKKTEGRIAYDPNPYP